MKSSLALLLAASSWQHVVAVGAGPHGQLQQPIGPASGKLKLSGDLINFHQSLVEIESTSHDEANVGEWLAESLSEQGYSVEKQYISKDPLRFNVLAWPGKVRNARILLTSHIDTVPPFIPYSRDEYADNTTIRGRGSVDAKASVATQIVALNELLEHGKVDADDFAVLYVVGEEISGDGMKAANDLHLIPKTVIFGEPTEGKLVSGHKGNIAVTIQVNGRASHSGYPWLGLSANEVLVKSLGALIELGETLPKSDKYGSTTINLGRIDGGVAGNVVPKSATAMVTVRIAEGSADYIRKEVTRAVHAAVQPYLKEGQSYEDIVTMDFSKGYGPVDLDADVPGFEKLTVNYGTDVPNLDQTVDGQKRYLYGPGSILVAHGDNEALTAAELHDAVTGYSKIILHALGQSQ